MDGGCGVDRDWHVRNRQSAGGSSEGPAREQTDRNARGRTAGADGRELGLRRPGTSSLRDRGSSPDPYRDAGQEERPGSAGLAPIVRVPTEGDQNVRWIIKQVLESGRWASSFPRSMMLTGAHHRAVDAISATQDSKHPTPVGRRGCGCSGGSGWGLRDPSDYMRVADPWPLNPEAEPVALPMIESPAEVSNVNAILDVPGVTGVLVGPSDLTLNHGEGAGTVRPPPRTLMRRSRRSQPPVRQRRKPAPWSPPTRRNKKVPGSRVQDHFRHISEGVVLVTLPGSSPWWCLRISARSSGADAGCELEDRWWTLSITSNARGTPHRPSHASQ